jgi:hypothetical protein
MNRHSVRLLVAALAATGLAGCFDDPTSSLREGPGALDVSRSSIVIANGDSVQVDAYVRDAQGNPLPATGATWTTDLASVAVVALAAVQPPGDGSTRAFIKAANPVGAATYVRVTVRGLTDSIRVVSLPAVLPAGAVTVVGAASADTVGATAFTAGDTIEVRLPVSTLTFNQGASVVRVGTATAYTLFRADTLLRVLSRGPVNGPITVTNIIYAGASGTGAIEMDSLVTTDQVQAARARFRGTISVTGDTVSVTATGGTTFRIAGTTADTFTTTVYIGASRGRTIERTATFMRVIAPDANPSPLTAGITVRKYNWDANNLIDSAVSGSPAVTVNRAWFTGGVTVSGGILLTVTPPTGMTFNTTASDTNLRANVFLGTARATRISRTTTQMQVSVPSSALADYQGPFVITNLAYGGTYRIDSLTTSASYNLARPLFTGSTATTGNELLDTITVNAPAGLAFVTGASPSQVVTGGTNAIVLSRTAAQMVVIPSASGAVSLTNIDVGGTIFPTMTLATPLTVSSATGEANEPGNDLPGAVVISLAGTSAGAPLYIIGAVADGGDADDLFAYTLGATATVTLQLQFGGTGAGGAVNPDIDLLVCNAACTAFVPGGTTGATGANPENTVLTNQAAGTYNIYVNAWDTGHQMRSYRLVAYAQ